MGQCTSFQHLSHGHETKAQARLCRLARTFADRIHKYGFVVWPTLFSLIFADV